MATRSAIGYQLPSGRIKATYCHWDGYPKHQLPILIKHYNTISKVRDLIKPGAMSSLRTKETWERVGEDARDPQPLYYHERGEKDVGPKITKSIEDSTKFWGDVWCEHLYVFVPDVGWLHYKTDH
jgi:hypothetical protein|tara:strand:+ start:102 stop:476 length:375 start_codon:yes stop_codon:yes gene_type:complete